MLTTLDRWDRELFLLINSMGNASLDQVMVILSGQLIWLPFVAFAVYLFRTKSRTGLPLFLLFMALALVCSDSTASALFKNIFERLRPCREEDLRALMYSFGQKCGGRFGFVSSHAANSFALVVFTLSYLRAQKLHWLLLLIPALVALSRIYLGVHYPGDVLGGALIGAFWGYFFAGLLRSRGRAAEAPNGSP